MNSCLSLKRHFGGLNVPRDRRLQYDPLLKGSHNNVLSNPIEMKASLNYNLQHGLSMDEVEG
jgi:hypothetical protein